MCLEAHAAGDRFLAGDGCNTCVCQADGALACTERVCPLDRNGCSYDDAEHGYGERFPSTDGCNGCVCAASGLACTRRSCDGAFEEGAIPSPGQEVFDIEVVLEQTTADGAFDEGIRTYLRRNAGGFTNVWTTVAAVGVAELNGSYDPRCLDPRGFTFTATFDADGSASGAISKICETDLTFTVGAWEVAAP